MNRRLLFLLCCPPKHFKMKVSCINPPLWFGRGVMGAKFVSAASRGFHAASLRSLCAVGKDTGASSRRRTEMIAFRLAAVPSARPASPWLQDAPTTEARAGGRRAGKQRSGGIICFSASPPSPETVEAHSQRRLHPCM